MRCVYCSLFSFEELLGTRCYDDAMADLKQLEDLRRQNKRFLEKLTKQAEKLHESQLSRPGEGVAGQSSVCEAFTGCSGQCRAPLAERNRDQTVTGRASEARASYKPKTKLETFKTPGKKVNKLTL